MTSNTPAQNQPGPEMKQALAMVTAMDKARSDFALNAVSTGQPFVSQKAAAEDLVKTMNKVKRDHAAQKDSELVADIVERALGIGDHHG